LLFAQNATHPILQTGALQSLLSTLPRAGEWPEVEKQLSKVIAILVAHEDDWGLLQRSSFDILTALYTLQIKTLTQYKSSQNFAAAHNDLQEEEEEGVLEGGGGGGGDNNRHTGTDLYQGVMMSGTADLNLTAAGNDSNGNFRRRTASCSSADYPGSLVTSPRNLDPTRVANTGTCIRIDPTQVLAGQHDPNNQSSVQRQQAEAIAAVSAAVASKAAYLQRWTSGEEGNREFGDSDTGGAGGREKDHSYDPTSCWRQTFILRKQQKAEYLRKLHEAAEEEQESLKSLLSSAVAKLSMVLAAQWEKLGSPFCGFGTVGGGLGMMGMNKGVGGPNMSGSGSLG
jgi:hypothetical protein